MRFFVVSSSSLKLEIPDRRNVRRKKWPQNYLIPQILRLSAERTVVIPRQISEVRLKLLSLCWEIVREEPVKPDKKLQFIREAGNMLEKQDVLYSG